MPERFSPAVISNAFAIGDFDLKRFPKSWDKDTAIWETKDEGDPRPDYLGVSSKLSNLSCTRMRRPIGSGDVNRAALTKRAFDYARQLGVDRRLIVTNSSATNTVSFIRMIDGVPIWQEAEGFEVTFGSRGGTFVIQLAVAAA